MKITYFGNKFSSYKSSKSVLETLELLFLEFCEVKSYSSKQGKIAKFIDMVLHFFTQGLKSDKIIIDVYSTSAFYFAWILGFLSFVFKKKYILFLHGGNLPNRYEKNPQLVAFLFKNSYKIIAPSHYLKSFFETKGFKITYIPNTIEIQDYPFQQRKHIQPKFLALRGFGKPYNPLMTLKAINILKEKYPNLELLLIGNENEFYYHQVVSYIQENQLEKNVKISNKIPKKEWIKLSKNYDIMISNPIIDNTPVSILEGMALGMCVISTNVGGVPFLVENEKEVLLVDLNNEKELVNKIEFLLKNSLMCEKLSINSRKKAETFSWENIKPMWKDLLFI